MGRPGSTGQRRALAHQGGAARVQGDPEVGEGLAEALTAVHGAPRDVLTHGFHTYPARMHYAIARRVLERWSEPATRVLDPFCGSGTVLVEARRLGLRSCGVDLNPLGVWLSEIKCARPSEAERRQVAEAAEAVVEASFDRVSRRQRVRAPLPKSELRWYQPHVLLELAGLHAEIEALPRGPVQASLLMVFSALVLKFSRQRSETTEREATAPRRIGKKVVTGFFARKVEELLERWDALAEVAPAGGPSPRVVEGDARRLRSLLDRWRFDLILSSPPYGGTYDYADHHARRYPWLRLSMKTMRDGELGSRRELSQGKHASRRWAGQVHSMLTSMAKVLSPQGRVVLLVGDAQIDGRRISAERQLSDLAPEAGLRVVASASQQRPDFAGGPPRREHLVALAKVDRAGLA